MKSKLLAVIAVAVGLAPAIPAQTIVEYSNLSAQAAKSLTMPTATTRIAPQKTAAKSDGAPSGPVIWEEKSARGKDQPLSKPVPPAVFILSNGEQLETSNYLLTVDSLRVGQGGMQRTIPLSKVNLDATLAANHRRGIDLMVPTNKYQIMLGF